MARRNISSTPMKRLFHRPDGVLSRMLAIAILAQLLVALGGAVAPEFHEELHHDAEHEDHECAITLIAGGGVESVAVPVVAVPQISQPVALPQPSSIWIPSIHQLSHLFANAPPLG
jgi:hypothetical protein